MTNEVFSIILKHGEDDYSVWTPDFTGKENQDVLTFLEQYTDNGDSIRGTKQEILDQLTESI
ncbi:hypothetical protein NHG32_06370 [Aerococcaceae bacterium NML191219]|nr:hypothetical protein [Aerococcaceae bacterium NML191219]